MKRWITGSRPVQRALSEASKASSLQTTFTGTNCVPSTLHGAEDPKKRWQRFCPQGTHSHGKQILSVSSVMTYILKRRKSSKHIHLFTLYSMKLGIFWGGKCQLSSLYLLSVVIRLTRKKKKNKTKQDVWIFMREGEDSSLLFQTQTHIITFMIHLEPKDTE